MTEQYDEKRMKALLRRWNSRNNLPVERRKKRQEDPQQFIDAIFNEIFLETCERSSDDVNAITQTVGRIAFLRDYLLGKSEEELAVLRNSELLDGLPKRPYDCALRVGSLLSQMVVVDAPEQSLGRTEPFETKPLPRPVPIPRQQPISLAVRPKRQKPWQADPNYVPRLGRDEECSLEDRYLFDSNLADLAEEAKVLCRRCPVKELCLEEAIKTDNYEGVMGGLTGRERHKLAKGRRQ